MIDKIKLLMAMAIVIGTLTGCSGYTSAESRAEGVAEAAAALDAGDNSRAKSIADGIVKDAKPDEMSASIYGGLSIIYMRLSDCDDMEDNTALAYQCYRNAYKVNADSAAAFYGSVASDNAQYVHMLSTLQQQLDNPNRNNIPDHEDEGESTSSSTSSTSKTTED